LTRARTDDPERPPSVRPPPAQLTTDNLDGFVIPLTDEHMSEYVVAVARSGSAGSPVFSVIRIIAVVLADCAAIFTRWSHDP
jgi:hypothetical protein